MYYGELYEYHLFSYQSRAHVQQSIYRQQHIIFPIKSTENVSYKYTIKYGHIYNRTMMLIAIGDIVK